MWRPVPSLHLWRKWADRLFQTGISGYSFAYLVGRVRPGAIEFYGSYPEIFLDLVYNFITVYLWQS